MKHLRQYIRQVLLNEAMKTPADLPDDVVVVINADSKAASIYYGMANNPSEYASLDRSTMGAIDIYSLKGHPGYGNCGDAWMVGGSGAQEGFGPLLYDIAIEWATQNGGGLIIGSGITMNGPIDGATSIAANGPITGCLLYTSPSPRDRG